ncbi:MAG: 1,4-dihydroxy-2-naphthoate octaprenyltransferase, partial [Verrucomicrobia bacterium]|nr:1,4-dihydroxy-2-naphthoate octaprenyltransferase [Verrucomicrobiota bacterium]
MPYGYLGLGELFVLIFFGPVAVACTYYVQTLTINGTVVLAGLGPGLLAVAILVVNNLRDVSGDAKAGKKTLAVRFGRRFARREYVFCILGAVGVPVLLFYLQRGDHPVVLLAVLTLPLIRPTMIKVCSSDSPADLNLALGHTARALLVYAILFAIGWVWS